MPDEIAIYGWDRLSEAEWNSLLLGNGASIAIHDGFGYSSLYDVAVENGLIDRSISIFREFDTSDFEYVLFACWQANLVNQAIGAPSEEIARVYEEVREALISAVGNVHPNYDDVTDKLDRIGAFASKFETVVTLNYDVTLYWAMMRFNEENGIWFKDAFLNQEFEPSWEWLRAPYRSSGGATLVFYLHGNLALAKDRLGSEVKVSRGARRGDERLLDSINEAWRSGDYAPLFVSEGASSEKVKSIRRSPYLSAVYNGVLTDLGQRVVIYGVGFSDRDRHMLDAIKKNPPHVLAIAVFSGKSAEEKQAYCHEVLSMFKRFAPATKVIFFESNSDGCWVNP